MVPKEMDMDQHSNAGKKKGGKEVADGFNLQKEEIWNESLHHAYFCIF